jgi:hypothetical protein
MPFMIFDVSVNARHLGFTLMLVLAPLYVRLLLAGFAASSIAALISPVFMTITPPCLKITRVFGRYDKFEGELSPQVFCQSVSFL